MANYDYKRVLSFTDEIIQGIGINKLYTDINPVYKNAPFNYCLGDYSLLMHFVIENFEKKHVSKSIYLIERRNLPSFQGLYLNMHENIYININDELNEEWKRFIIIKALCSAFAEHYQDSIIQNTIYATDADSPNNSDFPNLILQKLDNINTDGLVNDDLDSETFSTFLTIELMIPRPYRKLTIDYLQQVAKGLLTLREVAESLVIPEVLLNFYWKLNYV